MSPLVPSLVSLCKAQDLIPQGARVLIALSGGPDSCALLLGLMEASESGMMPPPVVAAHFHHGVRGRDADEDAAFCASLCSRFGIPLVIGLGAVPTKHDSYSSANARNLRYSFLLEIAEEFGADRIATAHTADDQAETVLGRVLRGTGIDGLAGIPVKRQLTERCVVIRPLLRVRRSVIEEFCTAYRVHPRHDPSNYKLRYLRTRLRHLLPELASNFNPQVYNALNRLADNAAVDNDLLRKLADELWQTALRSNEQEPIALDRSLVSHAHPAIRRRVLLSAIRRSTEKHAEEAATAISVERIENLLINDGSVTLPGNVRVIGRMNTLSFIPPKEDTLRPEFYGTLPIPGTLVIPQLHLTVESSYADSGVATARDRQSLTIALDSTALSEPLLIIRPPHDGERFQPLGMGGRTRAVRDILSQHKVPVERRSNYPIVARADTDGALWIIGIAQSESTRIVEETRERVRLQATFGRT